MSHGDTVREGLRELAELAQEVGDNLGSQVEVLGQEVSKALGAGRKLLFCGNGGSAADAQHLAAEYVVRFGRERKALPAIALTTDTSVLTACANDRGYESVFARQVEALGSAGDILFLHSTSGHSANLIRAADAAARLGVRTVAFLARDGGALRGRVDVAIVVPTSSTPRAQEIHLALGHMICEMVENRLVGEEE